MHQESEMNQSGRKFAGIPIPSDLKWSHFLSLYLATWLISCLMAVPAVLQPAFLKEVINIPKEQAGSINSGLQNMSQIATLLFIGLIGVLSDKVGRKILTVLGFLVCGIFFILFGYAKDISLALGITSIGGQIVVTYIIRFIIGIGIILSFPQTITMVADYVSPRDRGKGMALHGLMMSVGSIMVFGVMVQVARKTGLMSLFYMSGAVGFLGVISSRWGLVDRMPKEKAKRLGIKEIYRVVSKSVALRVSYVATLIARADIVVLSVFLIVWMVYVAEKFGMDPVKATARGGITLLVMSLACLISYPIIGILLDRWGRIQIVLLGLLMSGVGLCIMAATQNPFTPGMFLYVSLVGIGFSAANVGANTLAADSSPMPLLGSILGGLNTMQPIGILFFLQLGGLLLDQVGYWTPFALKGLASLICCLYILSVRKGIVVQKHEGMPPHGMPNK
ncbi:MAG TPA: MFS transporter [Thermodesulfobacteriota bacterium]|nr:MFS transporter [Thermodesulfobacteriota bacterium]